MSWSEADGAGKHSLAVHSFPCRGRTCLDAPLVLLHGWGADSRSWQPLREALNDTFSITAIDLPGFGDSPVSDDDVASVLARLDSLLPSRCVLVGWSLGGMLATLLAQRAPGRVAALITLAANACYVARPGWPHAMAAATMATFCAAFADNAVLCLKRFGALQASGDREGRAVTRQLREWQKIPEGPQQVAWLRGLDWLRELDLRPALRTLTVPSLHLFGSDDALVPAAAAADLAALAAGQTRVLEGCGHAFHVSQPALVAELMKTFLREHCPGGSFEGRPEDDADLEELPAEQLDKQAVARSFSRAAARYDSAAHLQRRLGERLLAGLPDDLRDVRTVLDLGCGTGYCLPALQAAYPSARLLAADLAEGMVAHARRERPVSAAWFCADAEQLPLQSGTIDVLFSNLAFQWCENLPQLAGELQRVLSPHGYAVFTTLGPGTLAELRQAWAAVDDAVHVNRFPGRDTVRDALLEAGFERIALEAVPEVVHYPVLAHLLRELKTLGANNINRGRPAALTGRARIRALEAAYEAFRDSGGLPATWEVYFIVARKDA